MTDHNRCAFCQALDKLRAIHRDDARAFAAAEEALWDRYDRAARARQLYGRRRGR